MMPKMLGAILAIVTGLIAITNAMAGSSGSDRAVARRSELWPRRMRFVFKLVLKNGVGDYNCGEIVSGY